MRVVLTHYLSHDTCTLLCRFVMCNVKLVHTVHNTAVNRFETVTHIWQGTSHNNGHSIVNIRRTHFVVNIDWDYSTVCHNSLLYLFFLLFSITRDVHPQTHGQNNIVKIAFFTNIRNFSHKNTPIFNARIKIHPLSVENPKSDRGEI